MIVESDIGQRTRQRCVPVLSGSSVAKSEMPFAYGTRAVTAATEHIRHRILRRPDNHTCISGGDTRIGTPPGIFAGKERIPRRSRRGRHGMNVGESRTLTGKTVHRRSLYPSGSVRLHIAVAKVISQNYYHIWPRRRPRSPGLCRSTPVSHQQWRGKRRRKNVFCVHFIKVLDFPHKDKNNRRHDINIRRRNSAQHPEAPHSSPERL